MKQTLLNNQRNIVFISSIISIILFVVFIVMGITTIISISSTTSDLLVELSVLVYQLPLVVPALLGIFYFFKKSMQATMAITISYLYLVYLGVNLLAYIVAFQSTDALEVGLFFLFFAIPVSLIISIILGAIAFTLRKNQS